MATLAGLTARLDKLEKKLGVREGRRFLIIDHDGSDAFVREEKRRLGVTEGDHVIVVSSVASPDSADTEVSPIGQQAPEPGAARRSPASPPRSVEPPRAERPKPPKRDEPLPLPNVGIV
jgi:hypothetical protein